MVKASNIPNAQPTAREEWRAIPGWPHFVSSLGRVKTARGRILKPFTAGYRPYLRVALCGGGKARQSLVASLVAGSFIGPRPAGLDINHKNGIKTDNRVENLEYCTRSENVLHAYAMGLNGGSRGEVNGQSKLTKKDVIAIRAQRGRRSSTLVAKQFGVCPQHIRALWAGKWWKHIADALLAAGGEGAK